MKKIQFKSMTSLIAVIAAFCLISAVPVAAHGATGLDNPSGKTDKQGDPLVRPLNHNKPSPKKSVGNIPAPECPPIVRCVFVPAAYQRNDPNDPSNYGNYDTANRPTGELAINQIVIHDTEGDLASTIDAFQDPLYFVSTHYVIDTDGTIYQMVENKNVAWHAGNYYVNQHSIGIEHVGHAANGINDFTPAMYFASSQLVKYLADKYNIPKDTQHIIGHYNVPAPTASRIPTMHMDPGPFWNWQNYFALMGAPVVPQGNVLTAKSVVVAPIWPLNKQPVTGCFPDVPTSCVNTTTTPTSFTYVHTAPSETSPYVTDPILGQGSTDLGNNAAKAYYGQKFAVLSRTITNKGIWWEISYVGQMGWIYSPFSAPTVMPSTSKHIAPKAGLATIPVYGRAYPEISAYPADFTNKQPVVSLPYTISAGQKYTLAGSDTPTDYYYAWTFDLSLPYDHTVFKGNDKYLRIQYNGREAYVRAADVNLTD